MDVSTLIQLATLISVIVGLFGLLGSIRAYKRQVNAQFLLEYTRRADEVMQALPPHVWATNILRGEEPPEASEELTFFATDRAFCRYVDRVQGDAEPKRRPTVAPG